MTKSPQIHWVEFSPEASNDLAGIRRNTFDQFLGLGHCLIHR